MLFKIQSHTHTAKFFDIEGPINLTINYDDVNHDEVDAKIDLVVSILNDHWPEWSEYYKIEEYIKCAMIVRDAGCGCKHPIDIGVSNTGSIRCKQCGINVNYI